MIDSRSFAVLVIFFMVGTSILIAPSVLAESAKQDAWIGALLAIGLNMAIALLYAVLGGRFPDKSLIQYSETVLGKWVGKTLGLCFILFYYLLAALMMGDLGFFLTSQSMPETPIEVLQGLFALAIIYAVRSGFVVYTRAAMFFFPWLLVLFLLLLLPLLPKFDLNHFAPVLEFGFKPIVKGGLSMFGFQELIILLMFYPYVRQSARRGKSLLIGTLIGGGFLIFTTFASVGVLSAKLAANRLFPAYTLAKNISVGHFFERVEGIMILIWVLSIFIKTVLTFHASLLGMVQLLNIREEKPFIVPLAIGLIPLSLICYSNSIYVHHFLAKFWTPLAILILVVLPLLILGTSMLRRLKETSS